MHHSSSARRGFLEMSVPRPGELAEIYSDSYLEHEYRRAVASILDEHCWSERAQALRFCGCLGIEIVCMACSAPHLVPFRCGARTCPSCARATAHAIVERIWQAMKIHDEVMLETPWDGVGRRCNRRWRFVTLTRRPSELTNIWSDERIRRELQQARPMFAGWWRTTPWGRQVHDEETGKKRARRDTSYELDLEISPGGMVHIHALVYGEYIGQDELLAAWRFQLQKIAGVTDPLDGGCRVQKMTGGKKGLKEVLKYITAGASNEAGDVEQMPTAFQAAMCELAFRNIKHRGAGGLLRKILSQFKEEITQAELAEATELECQVCGTVREWKWGRIVGRSIVSQNHGFGLYRYTPLGDDIAEIYFPPPT